MSELQSSARPRKRRCTTGGLRDEEDRRKGFVHKEIYEFFSTQRTHTQMRSTSSMRCGTQGNADDGIGTPQNDSGVAPPPETPTSPPLLAHIGIDQSAGSDEEGAMKGVREEMEKLKEERERRRKAEALERPKAEARENGTRGVHDRWCCFCAHFTKTGPNDTCDKCSGPRCSPGCGHLYNPNRRKQIPESSDKESEVVPETKQFTFRHFTVRMRSSK
jgi:hypothetical protein